jgi:hypothetical protein
MEKIVGVPEPERLGFFWRDLRARVRVKSYEKFVYLGFPWEFEGCRGTIRRPHAPSRMPDRPHGHPRNFDIFDIYFFWGGGGVSYLHLPPPIL